jgi:protein TonB
VPPSFPGGHDSLGVYLKYNTIYPEVYQKYAYRETLIVKFVIEKNGSISSVELIQGGFREFEKIALDLVKNMPRWNPAMQNDELRRCYFAILVKFCPEGCAGW